MRKTFFPVLLFLLLITSITAEEKASFRNLILEDNGQERIMITLEKGYLYSFMKSPQPYSINICFSNDSEPEAAIFYYHRKLVRNQKNGCYSFPGMQNIPVLFLTKEKWEIYFTDEKNKYLSSINIPDKVTSSEEINLIPLVWIRNSASNSFPDSIRLVGEYDNKMETTHQIHRRTKASFHDRISSVLYANYLYILAAEFILGLLLVFIYFLKRKTRQTNPQTWNYYTYSLEALHEQVKLQSLNPELKGSIKWKKKGLMVKLKGQKKILLSPEEIKDKYKIVINPAFYLELEPFFLNDPSKKLLKININFFRVDSGKRE